MSKHKQPLDHVFLTRRELLCRCGMGIGAVGLGALLQDRGLLSRAGAASNLSPLVPKQPHFPAKDENYPVRLRQAPSDDCRRGLFGGFGAVGPHWRRRGAMTENGE